MTSMKKFDRAMEKQLNAAEQTLQDIHVNLVRLTYEKVHEFSPVYSGYYVANHRISFNGDAGISLNPKKRNGREGAHRGQIESAKQGELAKLSSKDVPAVVTLGTAVPYAEYMEHPGMSRSAVPAKTGQRPIYGNARTVAIAEFESKLK